MFFALVGKYYDGRIDKPNMVNIFFLEEQIEIKNDELDLFISPTEVKYTSQIAGLNRLFVFKDDSQCSCQNTPLVEAWIKKNKIVNYNKINKLEQSTGKVFLIFCCFLAFIILSYKIILPFISNIIADNIPAKYLTIIDKNVLNYFENNSMISESKLSKEKKNSILNRVNSIAKKVSLPEYKIHFYASGDIGANAFAMPGGNIVITDDLINICDNDEITAVLLHEIGHIKHKHSMKQVIRASAISLIISSFIGDFSSLVNSFYAIILENKYSKEFEIEADIFAAKTLEAINLSPELLVYALKNIIDHANNYSEKKKKTSLIDNLFSTHPTLEERSKQILDVMNATNPKKEYYTKKKSASIN